MKVRCINNTSSSHLTLNKIYDASKELNYAHLTDKYYIITGDNNVKNTFYCFRFIPLSQDRKKKLEKLKLS